VEIETFRKSLAGQGCRFDQNERHRHEGPVMVTVHRDDRRTQVPLGGSRQILDQCVVRQASEDLGLDWFSPATQLCRQVSPICARVLPKIFFAGNGVRLSERGNLSISAIPGVDQQLPIVNIPANQLGISQTTYSATALIGATVPLYDGGSRAALLEQARDKVDKAETTLTQIRNEAVRQIVVAGNTLKTSVSAYSASTELAAAAQTTFDAALAAYRNGVGSISDVTTAERQLLAAKKRRYGCLQHRLGCCCQPGAGCGHAWRAATIVGAVLIRRRMLRTNRRRPKDVRCGGNRARRSAGSARCRRRCRTASR
jgi:hypothetical protein